MQRAARKQWTLKPQDLAVALKLSLQGGEEMSYAALAKAMRLSPYEAHAAVQRLCPARLVVSGAGSNALGIKLLRRYTNSADWLVTGFSTRARLTLFDPNGLFFRMIRSMPLRASRYASACPWLRLRFCLHS